MVASLRFSGLADTLGRVLSVLRAMACSDAPDMSRCILWRVLLLSKLLLLDPGLRTRKQLMFSWPDGGDSSDEEDGGVELPAHGDAGLRARFVGLLGEVLDRAEDLEEVDDPLGVSFAEDLEERNESLTLGRNGVARGGCARTDCVVGALFCELKAPNCCEAMRLKEGDAGEGEFGIELIDASEPCDDVLAR